MANFSITNPFQLWITLSSGKYYFFNVQSNDSSIAKLDLKKKKKKKKKKRRRKKNLSPIYNR